MAVQITLPDGSDREYPDGVTGADVAASIGARLAKAAVAVKVDGEPRDLSRAIEADSAVEIVTENTEAGRHIMRHSAAHVLAQAVLDRYPEAKFAVGPPIEDGFYYDFEVETPFTPDDLDSIEARMAEIIAADQPFEREVIAAPDAEAMFHDQPFKIEIIQGVDESEGAGGTEVSIYRNLEFADLCRGPHVPSTGRLSAMKLLRSAGAYWRGDENNPQLQRIYGTAWESKKELDAFLNRREEAAKRDHRKLGRELDLYSFPQELGSGLAIWHPNGGMLRKVIEDYSRQIHEDFGFVFVNSPHVAKAKLWQTSGHLDFYSENMYPGMELDEGEAYRVKPMNCPFHVLVYKSQARSYRELPLRFSELGAVYRYERSGVLHGLLRVRGLTMDDSHTFTTREQIADELATHLDFVVTLLSEFGFTDFEADLSTRPEDKWVGELDLWETATNALRDALVKAEVPFQIAEGEGAFYGPKIDVHIRDAIGRRWQMSTIQVDFSLPERFELEYTAPGNDRQRPVMIHSAKFGSVERFIGVLVEHYAGALPGWLSPIQATVVPVADRHDDYAGEVAAAFRAAGVRIHVDTTDETVGEKIRRAITHKHPAVLVVGDNDVERHSVGLRLRGDDTERRGVPLEAAVEELAEAFAAPR
ncbi:MAG: threonine--tRNA ligase [bacterium]|nr:threonine--tRNA ligase [bacterium]